MKKNQIIENVMIDSLGYGGVGIARLANGKKVLIKGALPQSIVDITIVKKKKDYMEGHIVRVHKVAPERLDGEVKCPHYLFGYQKAKDQQDVPEHKNGCGGCKRQVVSYEKQLLLKRDIVADCFNKLTVSGNEIDVYDVLPSPLLRGYRNKIEFSFGKYLKKNPDYKVDAGDESPSTGNSDGGSNPKFSVAEHRQAGFHKQGEFSKVVDIDQCYLISQPMHRVYVSLKKQLLDSGLPVYDVVTHQGFLRHMVIREGVHTEQLLVNIAVATNHFVDHPHDNEIWNELLNKWKQDPLLQGQITTLVITENNGVADVVNGQEIVSYPIRGEGRIFEALHFSSSEKNIPYEETGAETKVRFQVSPFSFFQTNTTGAELLFHTALQMAGNIKGNVIDLYCGSGSIGLSFLALGAGKRVKGIEIVPSAVHDAYENAKINGLGDRADFYVGRAEVLLKEGMIDNTFFIGDDLIVVDPPRDGLHPKVIDFLLSCRKQFACKLLYISCNPNTMARDISLLIQGGFRLGHLQPVDMFPHTHHIEVIGLLR